MAAGAYPLQGAGARTVLRTTLGGRPPPRVPFVSASCREQAQTMLKQNAGGPGSEKLAQSSSWSPKRQKFLIIARLRRSLASTPNIRSVRCMLIFHHRITRSLETLASCRQRGGRFGRGSVPVARGSLGMVLRTTLGVRPPPRGPFVSASCREQAQTILRRLRRPRHVDHHRERRSCPRAALSKTKQCLKDSGGPGSAELAKSRSQSTKRMTFQSSLA